MRLFALRLFARGFFTHRPPLPAAWRWPLAWLAAASLILAGSAVQAEPQQEKLLRWQFQPGQQLDLHVLQKVDLETIGAAAPTKVAIESAMEMQWQVGQVDPQGTAQITQSFTRLQIKMDAPGADPVHYDSAAPQQPAGPARDIAAAVQPLIGAEFALTMTSRGQVQQVELSDQAARALAEAPAAPQLRALFSKEGIRQLLQQSAIVLPQQPVQAGDEWTQQLDLASPVGDLRQFHTFTYEGTEPRNDRPLEKIRIDTRIELDRPQQDQQPGMQLKQQRQTGQLYFDAERGRVASSHISQRMLSETPVRDRVVQVRVRSTLEMEIRE